MSGVWPEIAAWIGLPVVLLVTGAGVGLLVERLLRSAAAGAAGRSRSARARGSSC